MGPWATRSAAERTLRQQNAAILSSEAVTADQDSNEDMETDPMTSDLVDRAPYPTRMRVILILSLLSWMIVALAIAWALR